VRERRRLQNQTLFRDVNERILEIGSALDRDEVHPAPLEFFCECGNAGCTARLRLDVAEYREVRGHPERFIVAHGHADEDLEQVVEVRDGYDVVELYEPVT
jgi:hypothetical protein